MNKKVVYRGKPWPVKYWLATIGNKHTVEQFMLVDYWRYLFQLQSADGKFNDGMMKHYGHTPATYARDRDSATKDLLDQLRYAIEKHDGSFLHAMADIIEKPLGADDPEREWLLSLHFDNAPPFTQKRKYTLRQLCQKYKEWHSGNREIDPSQMARWCKGLDIKLLSAKPGRPRNQVK